ncbi:DUF4192 domain-containing protein [Pseudonocardia thermophila]|uniref:DUF4192 domain-containing protein n=1 Tax=Pseudonocardia thermophila TaxID=1848 RepID=UPI00248F34F0|nr:DUF4192 domain-containing protein [Pseudonocardia thermophila]
MATEHRNTEHRNTEHRNTEHPYAEHRNTAKNTVTSAGEHASPTRPRAGAPPGRIRQPVRSPGELVAALPSMLGFHPRESLVLVALRGAFVDLLLRCDLPRPDDAGAAARFAEHGVAAVARTRPDAALLVVVTEGAHTPAGPRDGTTGEGSPPEPPMTGLAAEVSERLAEAGIPLHTAVWAAGTGPGARWGCYTECRCRDTVPAAAVTAFAAGAAYDGVVVRPSREALQVLVTPTDPAAVERRERLVADLIDDVVAADGAVDPEDLRGLLMLSLHDAAENRWPLDDQRIVALAVALGSPGVLHTAIVVTAKLARDGSPQERLAAEQLWATLTRESPDPEAAAPASLLAISALLRGDGALANVALDRAQDAWPGHVLSARLRAVAASGPRPDDLRDVLLETAQGWC